MLYLKNSVSNILTRSTNTESQKLNDNRLKVGAEINPAFLHAKQEFSQPD